MRRPGDAGMSADVIHCEACGGPVAEGDIRCRSCGSQVATVACPNCMGMVSVHAKHCENCGAVLAPIQESPSDLPCPSCKGVKLTGSMIGDVEIDQCLHCGGVWLRQDLFDRVASDKETRGRALGMLPITPPTQAVSHMDVVYRPCPSCAKMMNRYNYARISGVILDGCKGHGLWFDRDELRQVLEFVQVGGLDKSRERESVQLGEEKRTAAQMTRIDMGMHPASSGEYSDSWNSQTGTGLLSDLVQSVMDHFIV